MQSRRRLGTVSTEASSIKKGASVPKLVRKPGGLEAVFLGNREALLRFLRARGAGEDAEDILQELWVRVSLAQGRPIAEPLAYLYRMADHRMLDVRRSALRRQLREEHWVGMALAGRENVAETGEDHLLARQQLQGAEAALAALGERTNWIFRRFRIEGVPQHEIASDLGISLSGVEKHLQKAYRALLDWRRRCEAD